MVGCDIELRKITDKNEAKVSSRNRICETCK